MFEGIKGGDDSSFMLVTINFHNLKNFNTNYVIDKLNTPYFISHIRFSKLDNTNY